MKKVLRNILLGFMVLLFAYLGYVKDRYYEHKLEVCIEQGNSGYCVITSIRLERTGLWWVIYDFHAEGQIHNAEYITFNKYRYEHANVFYYDERDIGRKFKAKYCDIHPDKHKVYFDQEIKD